jgi:class 3 adenylate cyclase
MIPVLKNLFAPKKKAMAAFSGTGVVFMADSRSVAQLSERISPEEIIERLNRTTTALITAVEAHGGVVHQYIGGSLVAYWPPSKMPEAIGSAMAAGLDSVAECGAGIAVSVSVAGIAFSSVAPRPVLVGAAYSRAEATLRLASAGTIAVDAHTFDVLPSDLRSRVAIKKSHSELQ